MSSIPSTDWLVTALGQLLAMRAELVAFLVTRLRRRVPRLGAGDGPVRRKIGRAVLRFVGERCDRQRLATADAPKPRVVQQSVASAPTLESLLAAIDEGCDVAGGSEEHRACTAIRELVANYGRATVVIETLEDLLGRSIRPLCVRLAAVDGLLAAATPEAFAALGRMTSVTRKRLEWDGRAHDRSVLDALLRHAA